MVLPIPEPLSFPVTMMFLPCCHTWNYTPPPGIPPPSNTDTASIGLIPFHINLDSQPVLILLSMASIFWSQIIYYGCGGVNMSVIICHNIQSMANVMYMYAGYGHKEFHPFLFMCHFPNGHTKVIPLLPPTYFLHFRLYHVLFLKWEGGWGKVEQQWQIHNTRETQTGTLGRLMLALYPC